MKTHILLTLLTLVISACASKEHLTANQERKLDQAQELQTKSEYSQIDAGSRIR